MLKRLVKISAHDHMIADSSTKFLEVKNPKMAQMTQKCYDNTQKCQLKILP